jgi:NADH-quinone oxidoreductase subunit F
MIEQLGVDIITEKRLGVDFTLDQLKAEGYEAVFMSPGAPECMGLGIVGEDAKGVVLAGQFLKQYNIRGSVPVGKKVVVIGGGNAAIDAARTALRLGSEVTVVYRRTQEQMPAYAEEIEEALIEGVELRTLTQPVEVLKTTDDKVRGLKCMQMKLGEFDRSGRRRATESKEDVFVLEADQIIVAIGQRLEAKKLLDGQKVLLGNDGFIKVDPVTCQTSEEWIFAGGDAASGPASVVTAVGMGEKAAVGIDLYLSGEEHAFWREDKVIDTDYDPDADPVPYPRERLQTIDVERRRNNFDEVEQPWVESVAVRQCKRCLRCDYGKTPQKAAENKEAAHA